MSSALIVSLEVLGVLGVLIGLAGYEIYTLRRDRKRDRERESSARSDEAP
ncbi:MAG: hypothetical protein KKC85_18035 [Gammaproteobacteria bacterium]|nr:hypothetical protein [Gammaproteobacteria bacterium]MBU1444348.1 hypothetical protein [Gammaproteobacteria bacterium]MBU2288310.1 hypothetical protein [Gammaproteobacteria bacterium]